MEFVTSTMKLVPLLQSKKNYSKLKRPFMQYYTENLKREIELLTLEESDKKRIDKIIREIEKQHEKLLFQNQRSENDKSISINILKRTVEELTEQKELVLQKTLALEENYEILQESYTELEQFMQVASHDLKAPLRRIGSFGQLLEKRFASVLSTEGTSYLKNIVEGVKHMSGIITDLLEHSKLDRETLTESINLHDLIQEILSNLAMGCISSGLSVYVPYKNFTIIGHRHNLMQIFKELIINAIKYRSETAPIIVINLDNNIEKEEWTISFCDNGVGLDEMYQDKAFLPFQRIDFLDRPGYGIGLADCKKSVTKHGGKIWYRKNNVVGTTFFFTIPFVAKSVSIRTEKRNMMRVA
jgi:light-regulated signal transduction histidine kinase (bacteriophytochrome)